jgi:hypothetical protein
VALRFKKILAGSMKTGIMNKDGHFTAGCVTQSFKKFRPEGLNGYSFFIAALAVKLLS